MLVVLINPKEIIKNNGLLIDISDEQHKIPLYLLNFIFILITYGFFNMLYK